MKYLVNLRTKEHIKYPGEHWYSSAEWSLIQADREGWIEITFGHQPLPEFCAYEIKLDNGKVYRRDIVLGTNWQKGTSVTHYRPILDSMVRASTTEDSQ